MLLSLAKLACKASFATGSDQATTAPPFQVYDALRERVHPKAAQHYKAFFSSELGGIITDPALMIVNVDDHMVHRGHAVFDTAEITHGHLYCLDAHFQRFLTSAAKAGIDTGMSHAQMYRIILETAAASRSMYGAPHAVCV